MSQDQPHHQGDHAPAQPPVVEQPPMQQPVNPYFAQSQGAPVQYIVASQSLKGIGGWLLFWVIILGLAGVGYITLFFAALTNLDSPSAIVMAIFAPFLAITALGAVVSISMQKKLGKLAAMAYIGVAVLYSVINAIVSFAAGTGGSSSNIATLMGSIVGTIVFGGLMILYFIQSRRVKETLVN
ncbi:membrane protein of unknown function [Candidatus Saccharimonas aalborgensis]|jgi:hypothetical protein|uniref:Uncharacterized protein n=1 Tax=Candidatus Saccharimonas aalborgensis TaxID=1332188 RepID=R4PYX3_9BACT|nr:membrane protein of unknown function [Candidatus Saccharimonas aalborgensis]AGL62441.1 membrane protein of unknown function [Candidatus Saccharimonas aalborgensis]